MNENIKKLLEKYDPTDIFEPILEQFDNTSIRGGSFVVVDQKALAKHKNDIVSRKGEEFFSNVMVLAKEKSPLYVSALKVVKPTNAFISELPNKQFEEADLVVHKTPGLYSAPITLPVSVLKQIVDPMFAHQMKPSDDLNQNNKIEKSTTAGNEYNRGEQPKGTITKGGNN